MQAPDAGNKRRLAALVKKINDEAGYLAIAPADETPTPYLLRRPSGIMQLDLDTGGGIPAGGLVKLTGPENAGKTYLMYLYMAMHQRIYGDRSRIVIGHTEWKPDHFQMRMAGMKVAIPDKNIDAKNRARVRAGLKPFTKEERAKLKEQIGEVYFTYAENGEVLLGNIVDMADENMFGIIGLDSMAMITPKDEAAKDFKDDRFNVRARAVLITNFHTQLHHKLNKRVRRMGEEPLNETSLILIDQVRANTDKANMQPFMQKFAKNYKESSPYAGKHASMITTLITEGKKIKATSGKYRGAVTGKEFKWELIKGSKGAHNHVSGSTNYMFAGGVDLQRTVLEVGLQQGIIYEKGGALFVQNAAGVPVLDDIKGGPDELLEIMRKDFSLEHDIRQFILQAQGIECTYD